METVLQILKFLLRFVSHPFGAFVVGVLIMYVVLILLDRASRKKLAHEQIYAGSRRETARVTELTAELESREELIRSLQEEVETYRSEVVKTARSEEDIQTRQTEERVGFEKQIAALAASNTALTEQTEGLTVERDDLAQQAAELAEALRDMQAEVHAGTERIKALEQEKGALIKALDTARTERTELDSQARELSAELKNQRSGRGEEINALRTEIAALKEINTSLENELAEGPQEEEVLRLEEQKNQLAVQLQDYRQLVFELESRVGQYRRQDTAVEYSAVEEQVKAQAVRALSDEKDELADQLEQYKAMCRDLEYKVQQYRRQDTVTDESSAHRELVTASLSREKEELARRLDENAKELEGLKAALEELEGLREENRRLKKSIEVIAAEETSVQEKAHLLEDQLKAAAAAEEAREKRMARIEELQETIRSQDREMKGLKEQLQVMKHETTSFQKGRDDKVDMLHEEVSKIDDVLRELKSENAQLRNEVSGLNAVIEEKNRTFGRIAEVSRMLKDKREEDESRDLADEPALSDDDLIADILGPSVPRPIVAADNGFNVFLSRFTADDKREKAVALIADVAGLSLEEADKLSRRIVIPIAKGVEQAVAEDIKRRFMEIGVLARVKRQR